MRSHWSWRLIWGQHSVLSELICCVIRCFSNRNTENGKHRSQSGPVLPNIDTFTRHIYRWLAYIWVFFFWKAYPSLCSRFFTLGLFFWTPGFSSHSSSPEWRRQTRTVSQWSCRQNETTLLWGSPSGLFWVKTPCPRKRWRTLSGLWSPCSCCRAVAWVWVWVWVRRSRWEVSAPPVLFRLIPSLIF